MISQPVNITVCEGGTILFTCVIDIQNTNINAANISWWRKTHFHENDYLSLDSLMISQQSSHDFKIDTTIGDNLTSVLMITDVRTSDAGPYWLRLSDNKNARCNTINSTMAFLSIIPNGMYPYM